MKHLISSERAIRTELRRLDRAGVGISNRGLPTAEMDRLLAMFWNAVEISRQLTHIRHRINAAILLPALRDLEGFVVLGLTEAAQVFCNSLSGLCRTLYDKDGFDRADIRLHLGRHQDRLDRILAASRSAPHAAGIKAGDPPKVGSLPDQVTPVLEGKVATQPGHDYLAAWDEILPPVILGTPTQRNPAGDVPSSQDFHSTRLPSSEPSSSLKRVSAKDDAHSSAQASLENLPRAYSYPTLREMQTTCVSLREEARRIRDMELAKEARGAKTRISSHAASLGGRATDIEARMEKIRARLLQVIALALEDISARCGSGETTPARDLALFLSDLAAALDAPTRHDFWLLRTRLDCYQRCIRKMPAKAEGGDLPTVSASTDPKPPAPALVDYLDLWDLAHLDP